MVYISVSLGLILLVTSHAQAFFPQSSTKPPFPDRDDNILNLASDYPNVLDSENIMNLTSDRPRRVLTDSRPTVYVYFNDSLVNCTSKPQYDGRVFLETLCHELLWTNLATSVVTIIHHILLNCTPNQTTVPVGGSLAILYFFRKLITDLLS